ncbi:autotransporter outer membrane beta-barrel domain-containing protein [Pseudomonas putida]|uniref:autotransporter outer membrane beta-barrel domain-containing protein n=1 Tax=Pseudomonas putida TaxID=303 RepID=UPI0020C274E6|nr:autotransporter outer membrane beta-barrel domain-containing protein [Pseudomonas putida]UTL82545.1 autotransporter outer membrane beta-barrel domain-containing protein [Pseudomonas putida]
MTIARIHALSPLTSALLKASALLVLSAPAGAVTVVSDQLSIDGDTAPDSYVVAPDAQLDANGASTEEISLGENGRLNLQRSSVIASSDGVSVEKGGHAVIGDNSSVVSERIGLRLLRTASGGSTATVSDSRIEGARGGASLGASSALQLERSTVLGTGVSNAVRMFGNSTLNAEQSTLIGARAGVQVIGDSVFPGATQITLDGTRVQGLDGSAIVVGDGGSEAATADIVVGPGSSLQGSNGVILEVQAGSHADMQVNGSALQGDVRVDNDASANLHLNNQASLTGRLVNVDGLTLSNKASWTMVEDSSVGALAMNGGSVHFGQANDYQRLTLGTLSGQGTFVMDADFSTGQTDFLDVTGTATGSHTLLVGSSGAEPAAENQLHLVHAGAGDAKFSLLNGSVDVGAFSYELVQRGNDWYLDGSQQIISPGTASVLALFNTAPTVWYGELTTLRGRMGELRRDEGSTGAWVRAYGNKYNVSASAGSAYQQVQQGFSVGADAPLPWGDGQWKVGVLAGHSNSDLNLVRGASAQVKSYYLGLYTTWLDAGTGYYFDGVLKANRFANSSKVTLSDGQRAKGDYDNVGMGASVEFGRHLELADGYFIEPYTQWSLASIEGKDYHLDNGLQARGDDTRSLLGKAGATLGKTIDLSDGRFIQPYVRLAYAHEFVDNNEVKVNDHRFDNDLSGSRGELGVGVAVSLNDRLQLHADFDYANGDRIEQPWGANVGVRYTW